MIEWENGESEMPSHTKGHQNKIRLKKLTVGQNFGLTSCRDFGYGMDLRGH